MGAATSAVSNRAVRRARSGVGSDTEAAPPTLITNARSHSIVQPRAFYELPPLMMAVVLFVATVVVVFVIVPITVAPISVSAA